MRVRDTVTTKERRWATARTHDNELACLIKLIETVVDQIVDFHGIIVLHLIIDVLLIIRGVGSKFAMDIDLWRQADFEIAAIKLS